MNDTFTVAPLLIIFGYTCVVVGVTAVLILATQAIVRHMDKRWDRG